MTMEGEIESPPVLWPPARTRVTPLRSGGMPTGWSAGPDRRSRTNPPPLVVGRSVCAGDRKVAKALQPLEVAQAFHQAG
jgi:hypothetical protein